MGDDCYSLMWHTVEGPRRTTVLAGQQGSETTKLCGNPWSYRSAFQHLPGHHLNPFVAEQPEYLLWFAVSRRRVRDVFHRFRQGVKTMSDTTKGKHHDRAVSNIGNGTYNQRRNAGDIRHSLHWMRNRLEDRWGSPPPDFLSHGAALSLD